MITHIKKQLVLAFAMLFTSYAVFAAHAGHAELKVEELVTGEGALALPFSDVQVHYTGWLMNGTKFDSSLDRGQAFSFTLGAGQVIPGWDRGVRGMRAGGKRVLVIPPEMAYGARGAGNVIPPNATLKFEVELLAASKPPFTNIDNGALQQKLENGVTLIDIRRKDEWQETGVVPGSQTLTAFDERGQFVQSFMPKLRQLVEADEEFVLICRTGSRTAALTNWLTTQGGYPGAVNVQDGITDWIREQRPVSRWRP